ncbi:MAG: hypothetical protein QOG19_22, partial [Mycobacterium sp.]|nr:hypothetical protein [Mycobacterium sp.]
LTEAATNLSGIGSSLTAASSAAALPTTGVMAAGADEVSAAMAGVFGAHARQYQAVSAQAANLHEQFVQAMNNAGNAYAGAESANASPMQAGNGTTPGSVNTQAQGLLGRPPIGLGGGPGDEGSFDGDARRCVRRGCYTTGRSSTAAIFGKEPMARFP